MTGSLEQQKAKGAVEYTCIYYTDIHISETTTENVQERAIIRLQYADV